MRCVRGCERRNWRKWCHPFPIFGRGASLRKHIDGSSIRCGWWRAAKPSSATPCVQLASARAMYRQGGPILTLPLPGSGALLLLPNIKQPTIPAFWKSSFNIHCKASTVLSNPKRLWQPAKERCQQLSKGSACTTTITSSCWICCSIWDECKCPQSPLESRQWEVWRKKDQNAPSLCNGILSSMGSNASNCWEMV